MTNNSNISISISNNVFVDKFEELRRHMFSNMIVFELTKCCGYGTLLPTYKSESLLEVYNKVCHHMSCDEIKELYFVAMNPNANANAPMEIENTIDTNTMNQKIVLPITNKKTIGEFVRELIVCSPPVLSPIYELPNPVIYRLYIDDGHIHTHTHTRDEQIENNILENYVMK